MHFIALFFAGALLCNSLPHLASGLQGLPFPSPFAKPPGKGNSSPLVNVLWGAFNLLVGVILLTHATVEVGLNAGFVVLWLGALVSGTHLALHFGRVQRDRAAKTSAR